ncbi:hypothetical protein PRNP1_000414 [Phytophthora ramorum]
MSTKGKWLTIEQKCEVIAQHRREPATNYTQLAQWTKTRFELSVAPTRQTIRNIVQGAADIEAKRLDASVGAKGRTLSVRSQALEQQLQQFVVDCQQRDERLTRRLLNDRAREILDAMDNAPPLHLSVGWLTRFMKRHGLSFRKDKPEAAVETEAQAVMVGEETAEVVEDAGVQGEKKEHARVDELRQKATKRLREIETEAKDLRKFLRRLDTAQNNSQA